MCRICEGFSLDDVLALDAAAIDEYGFVVIGVGGTENDVGDHGTWAYTVGLLDAADHPEMIVAGPSVESGGSLLSFLGQSVLEGERYEVGETIGTPRGVVRVGAVNEVQYELDTFNMWHNLQRGGALEAPELEAVQIVVPSTWFCSCHRDAQALLDDPDARVDRRLPRPNRAERRRRRPRPHSV